ITTDSGVSSEIIVLVRTGIFFFSFGSNSHSFTYSLYCLYISFSFLFIGDKAHTGGDDLFTPLDAFITIKSEDDSFQVDFTLIRYEFPIAVAQAESTDTAVKS